MAFKEDMSEGRWMSEAQLEDEFKSKTHVQNYIKFASEHQLVSNDPKRDCRVFYYEKKLQRWGHREEGVMEATKKASGGRRYLG